MKRSVITLPHLLSLALPLLLALFILIAAPICQNHLRQQLANAEQERINWQTKSQQLQDDIITAKRLDAIKPALMPEEFYLPLDEPSALDLAKTLAIAHRLKNADLRVTTASQPLAHDGMALTQKNLILTASVPAESYLLSYLNRLGKKLPGKLQLVRLTMTRNATTPLTTTNLQIEAEFLWLLQAASPPPPVGILLP